MISSPRVHVGASIDADLLHTSRILIVDDEEVNVRFLREVLRREGYTFVESTQDPRNALELFRSFRPDLMLLDLHMPHLSGFEVLGELMRELEPNEYFPVLILTGDLDPATQRRALSSGARDFVNKPFHPTEVMPRIQNLLETRILHQRLLEQNRMLEERVRERTRDLADARLEILERLALASEYRDDVTGEHARRVGLIAAHIAEAMGCSAHEVELLRLAAPLHDLGKVATPDTVLRKAGPLSDAEFGVIKEHAEIGGRILSGSSHEILRVAETICVTHHERWDGGGYPRGLAGDDIPLFGRITSVADTFDTITHGRPYKSAESPAQAIAELIRCSGSQFDRRVVNALISIADRVCSDLELGPARVRAAG